MPTSCVLPPTTCSGNPGRPGAGASPYDAPVVEIAVGIAIVTAVLVAIVTVIAFVLLVMMDEDGAEG